MSDLPMARPDPWRTLRRLTSARIALGRAGGSLPTSEVLKFQLDHARARDAVHEPLDETALQGAMRAAGLDSLLLRTCASDRTSYLKNPDLGRRLSAGSREQLSDVAKEGSPTVALIVSDGLSALAARAHAAPLVTNLVPRLAAGGWRVSPVLVIPLARVAVQDEVGELLGAQVSVIVLGERPGLGSADSLGAYLVYGPRPGRTDAERNCVSNVRPGGMALVEAAETIRWMVEQMLRRRLSGVPLKDERRLGGAGSAPAEGKKLSD